jgi:hypothetical protein
MSYQLIDSTPFHREVLYEFLDAYFDSPRLQKMRNDDNSGVSVYMTRINSLLASPEQRFIIAIAPLDRVEPGTLVPLLEVKWQSLQTRMLPITDPVLHAVRRHSYQPKNTKKYAIGMTLKERYPDRTEYVLKGFENTCIVALKHSNPENRYEFRDQMVCSGSIELYRTLFVMI